MDILPVLHIFLTTVPSPDAKTHTTPAEDCTVCAAMCDYHWQCRNTADSRPARADKADGVDVSPGRCSAAGVMLTTDSLDSAGLCCWQTGVTGDI